MYYSKQEMKLAEYWGRRDFLNEKWFSAYINKSEELYGEANKLFRKYTTEYLKQLNKEELYLVIREVALRCLMYMPISMQVSRNVLQA